jgi:hypothetical protein
VQAEGVKGSKFCLFSVTLPARCVFSIFPRFHCRRHAFCFPPLAAILESSPEVFTHFFIPSFFLLTKMEVLGIDSLSPASCLSCCYLQDVVSSLMLLGCHLILLDILG